MFRPLPRPLVVLVSTSEGYGVRRDGSLASWQRRYTAASALPSGSFSATTNGCAIRTNGEVACWGTSRVPPSGTFTVVKCGLRCCGVRTDQTVECWGNLSDTRAIDTRPFGSEKFSDVLPVVVTTCGLRADGTIRCEGSLDICPWTPPPGCFTRLASYDLGMCALAEDASEVCWGCYVR